MSLYLLSLSPVFVFFCVFITVCSPPPPCICVATLSLGLPQDSVSQYEYLYIHRYLCFLHAYIFTQVFVTLTSLSQGLYFPCTLHLWVFHKALATWPFCPHSLFPISLSPHVSLCNCVSPFRSVFPMTVFLFFPPPRSQYLPSCPPLHFPLLPLSPSLSPILSVSLISPVALSPESLCLPISWMGWRAGGWGEVGLLLGAH